jgi:hypothetical protein
MLLQDYGRRTAAELPKALSQPVAAQREPDSLALTRNARFKTWRKKGDERAPKNAEQ